MKEIFLKCTDGCNILNVEKWEDEDQFCFIMYHGYKTLKLSLWKRIKILFKGYIIESGIILSIEDSEKLEKFIRENKKQHKREIVGVDIKRIEGE